MALARPVTPIDETIRLSRKYLVEDLAFQRVLVGRMHVSKIVRLIEAYGCRLLPQSARRLSGRPDNESRKLWTLVRSALRSEDNLAPELLHTLTDGISIVCGKFTHDARATDVGTVRLSNLRILRSGETVRAVAEALEELRTERRNPEDASPELPNAHLLVRILQVDGEVEMIPAGIAL